MTHEQLLSIMNNYTFKDSAEPVKVLRAVVELHKPWETLPQLENPLVWCEVCQENYPCPTIRAIEKELK